MDAKAQLGDCARRRRIEANRPTREGWTRDRRSLCRIQGNHRQLRGHPGRRLRRSAGDRPCVSGRHDDRDPRNGRLRVSEPRALVEHFFRHEFGRLGAVLTRSLGVRRLDLVEDVVQAALVQALGTWARRGVPEAPAGWLYRTARNLAIDALRRERTHAQALPRLAEDAERELAPLEAHFADEIGDEPLRLLFVCCHEAVPAESRVALALRTLCGFSTAEIARALLTTDANVQKRIERARDRLRELDVDFDTPAAAQLCARLDAVLAVVYLLFSQGCHVTHGDMPICRDLCDEARRLARMLADGMGGDVPAVHALLALMCFHAARFDARAALVKTKGKTKVPGKQRCQEPKAI